MNSMPRAAMFAVMQSLSGMVAAFTPMETNHVVRQILHCMVIAGSHDDWSTQTMEGREREVFADMDQFLSRVNCLGWDLDDKRAAFDWYLSDLSMRDARDMQNDEKLYASSALAYCYDLSYTNAIPLYRQQALNPVGFLKDNTIRLYLKSVEVGPEATSFTETIMTNVQDYTSYERFQAIRQYSDMVMKRWRAGGVVSNAVDMFFRNRNFNVTGSMTIDNLLVAGCNGYASSSNRIETCRFVLDHTNATERMRSYFTTITNQLLTSGQPLRQLNFGEAGE